MVAIYYRKERHVIILIFLLVLEVAKQPDHTTETFQYVATPVHVLTLLNNPITQRKLIGLRGIKNS